MSPRASDALPCWTAWSGREASLRVKTNRTGGHPWKGSDAVSSRTRPRCARLAALRRQVSIPLPVAVLAAALLLTFGVSLAVLATRQTMGYIRVTKAPAGGTEYQFAVPYDKVEALLKSMGGADANIESVMTIPKSVKLVPVGEPRMGKAAEFPRKKP